MLRTLGKGTNAMGLRKLGRYDIIRALGKGAMGAPDSVAQRVAANSRRWWRNSAMLLNSVLTIAYYERLGVPRLS